MVSLSVAAKKCAILAGIVATSGAPATRNGTAAKRGVVSATVRLSWPRHRRPKFCDRGHIMASHTTPRIALAKMMASVSDNIYTFTDVFVTPDLNMMHRTVC
jgi:hypothetical protein